MNKLQASERKSGCLREGRSTSGRERVPYFKDGSWYGMRGFMKRKPNGVNWVLLFNASMDPDSIDGNVALNAVREVHQAVERGEKFPDIDLFDEYR
jgi:hypothetical protein